MAIGDVLEGWPFENYGVDLRNMKTSRDNPGNVARVALSIPRPKYTYFAEFILNPNHPGRVTDIEDHMVRAGNGLIYTHLKAADRPKPTFQTDTLRSYNRQYKLQKKIEYGPFTLTFHNDSTSMVSAFIKEAIHFAHYSGSLGANRDRGSDLRRVQTENDKFMFPGSGPASLVVPPETGKTVRSEMNLRPSLGMRMQECGRTFLTNIVVYDLGTEPDSVDVYVYVNPILTAVDHQPLDYYDRSGSSEVILTFEYESFYSSVGMSKNDISDFVSFILGKQSNVFYSSSFGHATTRTVGAPGSAPECAASCGTDAISDPNFSSLLDTLTGSPNPFSNPGGSSNTSDTSVTTDPSTQSATDRTMKSI